MASSVAALLGVVFGLVGALPGAIFAHLVRKGVRIPVSAGLAATMASFCLLTFVLGFGYLYIPSAYMTFAAAVIAAFLVVWIGESIAAWRWIAR